MTLTHATNYPIRVIQLTTRCLKLLEVREERYHPAVRYLEYGLKFLTESLSHPIQKRVEEKKAKTNTVERDFILMISRSYVFISVGFRHNYYRVVVFASATLIELALDDETNVIIHLITTLICV